MFNSGLSFKQVYSGPQDLSGSRQIKNLKIFSTKNLMVIMKEDNYPLLFVRLILLVLYSCMRSLFCLFYSKRLHSIL
jgi:hypothetical protein